MLYSRVFHTTGLGMSGNGVVEKVSPEQPSLDEQVATWLAEVQAGGKQVIPEQQTQSSAGTRYDVLVTLTILYRLE